MVASRLDNIWLFLILWRSLRSLRPLDAALSKLLVIFQIFLIAVFFVSLSISARGNLTTSVAASGPRHT